MFSGCLLEPGVGLKLYISGSKVQVCPASDQFFFSIGHLRRHRLLLLWLDQHDNLTIDLYNPEGAGISSSSPRPLLLCWLAQGQHQFQRAASLAVVQCTVYLRRIWRTPRKWQQGSQRRSCRYDPCGHIRAQCRGSRSLQRFSLKRCRTLGRSPHRRFPAHLALKLRRSPRRSQSAALLVRRTCRCL